MVEIYKLLFLFLYMLFRPGLDVRISATNRAVIFCVTPEETFQGVQLSIIKNNVHLSS